MESASVTTLLASVCFKDLAIKCLGAIALITGNFLFDGILVQAMVSLFVLVIFDAITAMATAYKNKVAVTSRKMFRTPLKLAVYFLLISSSNIAENALPAIIHILDETILAFLVLTELISIIENIGKMGYAVPMKLLNRLHEIRDTK